MVPHRDPTLAHSEVSPHCAAAFQCLALGITSPVSHSLQLLTPLCLHLNKKMRTSVKFSKGEGRSRTAVKAQPMAVRTHTTFQIMQPHVQKIPQQNCHHPFSSTEAFLGGHHISFHYRGSFGKYRGEQGSSSPFSLQKALPTRPTGTPCACWSFSGTPTCADQQLSLHFFAEAELLELRHSLQSCSSCKLDWLKCFIKDERCEKMTAEGLNGNHHVT